MALSTHQTGLLSFDHLKHLQGTEVTIIATEWNKNIVATQIAGAQRVADELGVVIKDIIYVPGCVELPYGIRKYCEKQKEKQQNVKAIIAFGAVVRGDTPHFDYVCNMASEGINHLNLHLDIPVVFGVLTVNTEQQAWDRLGGSHGHKGEEAMITALKMIHLEQQF